MPPKEEKEVVSDWKRRILDGLEYRREKGGDDKWDKYLDYYRGKFEHNDVSLNIIYSNGRTLIPAVYFRNPRVNIIGRGGSNTYIAARILEQVVNGLLDTAVVKRTIKRMARDCYLYGMGCGFYGYEREFGWSPELASSLSQVTVSKAGDKRISFDTKVKQGCPWFLRDDPRNVVVPNASIFGDNLPWYARRYYRDIEDIKADPTYDNIEGLSAGEGSTMFSGATLSTAGGDAAKTLARSSLVPMRPGEVPRPEIVELWEIHDSREKTWGVLAPGMDLWVKKPAEDHLQDPNLPCEFLSWNEDGGYFWPTSDCMQIYWQQLEVNEQTRQLRDHRAIHVARLILNSDYIDEEQLADLKKGIVGKITFVHGIDDVRKILYEFTPNVPLDLIPLREASVHDARMVTGQGRNQAGEFAPGTRRTATEVAEVAAGSDVVVMEHRDLVGDLVVSIAKRFANMICAFWKDTQFEQITGPDGAPVITAFKGIDLAGDYRFRVNAEDSANLTLKDRIELGLGLLEKLTPLALKLLEVGAPMINIQALLKNALSNLPGINVDELLVVPKQGSNQVPGVQQFNPQQGLVPYNQNA